MFDFTWDWNSFSLEAVLDLNWKNGAIPTTENTCWIAIFGFGHLRQLFSLKIKNLLHFEDFKLCSLKNYLQDNDFIQWDTQLCTPLITKIFLESWYIILKLTAYFLLKCPYLKVCTVQVNFLEVQPTINLKDNLTWLWISSSLSRLKHEKIQIRALGQIGIHYLE